MSPQEDFNLGGLVLYTLTGIIYWGIELDEDNWEDFEEKNPKEDKKTSDELLKGDTDNLSEVDDKVEQFDPGDDFWF